MGKKPALSTGFFLVKAMRGHKEIYFFVAVLFFKGPGCRVAPGA